MTPEERKTLAMRHAEKVFGWSGLACEDTYPRVLRAYHEGFDTALGLLFYRYNPSTTLEVGFATLRPCMASALLPTLQATMGS